MFAAAQLGPNNEGTPREEIVERMMALLERAIRDGVEIIAYAEMALTTYFPKQIRADFDQFFETDMPPALGGEGTAPSPSVLARAALSSCLATGYVLRAARHGVELTSVTVHVEADTEMRRSLASGELPDTTKDR